jgi:SAM-dependent methyltransferase
VLDLNSGKLPEAAYDVVFALSCIHHVFQLEELFKQVRRAMKPGALFYLDEYIGPSRFRTSDEVTRLINAIRAALPDDLRRDLFANDGRLIGPYAPSPIEHFELHDPSEAVRSAEIVPILKMYFDIIEFRPYGGAILHMLLSGIAGNFQENSPKDVALLNVLVLMEEALEAGCAIEPEFAVMVARAK